MSVNKDVYKIVQITNDLYKKMSHFQVYYDIIKLPFGNLLLGTHDDKICFLQHCAINIPEDEILEKITKIFPNSTIQKTNIDKLPEDNTLLMKGTDFEISVWQQLLNIPKGHLASYEDVAIAINKQKGVRAVANAIGSNPITYVVPCHRVIRKNGTIGGYSGAGLEKKLQLLEFEGVDTSPFTRNVNKG